MKKVLVIGIVVTILLLLLMPSVSATWCDNNYGKKAPILINNTGGSAQTYYQVELNYTYDSDMNANFSDSRVYNESDCSLIPLWNESAVVSSYNKIWFNATNIPGSTWTNSTYYLYYDYSSASSATNITTTFPFGDDFEAVAGSKFEQFERYASNPLTIPEYTSNGVVHPDVVYFPAGIDGYKYWMVYTPYPPDTNEDPSIVRSNDGITWIDTGITNPVVNGSESWRDNHQHDPDFMYISDYSKWFMVWGGESTSGTAVLAFAYSTDGKTWTEYDGTVINGNTNPVILNGSDSGGQSWENDAGKSLVSCPTLLYESGTFYLYYNSQIPGNNRGNASYATFTWNNTTNDIENFARHSGDPVINLSADSTFKSGCGHLDISKYDGTYYMYIVRELAESVTFELALVTSTDKNNWTNKGKVLERGASGEWDDKYTYRASPVTDGVGSIILFSDEVKLFYSAFKVSTGYSKIGLAYGKDSIEKIDTDKWNVGGTGTVSVANGEATVTSSSTSVKKYITSKTAYSGGYAMRGRVKVDALPTDNGLWLYYTTVPGESANAKMTRPFGIYHSASDIYYTSGNETNFANKLDIGLAKDTNYHTAEVMRTGSADDFYLDGAYHWSGTYPCNTARYVELQDYKSTKGIRCDWVLVRKYTSPEPTASLGTEESPSVTYTPPNPTNLQHTSGNFYVNYTWDAGDGNVTNSYNVSNATAWINGSSNTYFNESLEASEWLNITVYAYNSSGGGTLSAGSVSDQQQAPSVSTKKFYETSTSDFSAEVAVIDLYTSRDGTANNVAYELATGNLYNYINATSNITVGNDIKIPAGTKVNFSAYFDDGDRVNYAYVTWKFYRLVGTSTTLICQKGDDSTGGVQIPDGTTETITGYCSVTSDVTFNSTDKVRLIVNVWAETIGGGGAATKVATHYWDSTHESWVEYKYQTTTTDTTFTVSLPVGYTKPVFEPPNSTATNYPPNGQTSSQEFFNVTNSGNVNLDVRMRLNTTVSTITLKADADNNPTGADTIGTSLVTIHYNLGQGSSANIWLWSDFDHTPAQTANRTVYINVSQS